MKPVDDILSSCVFGKTNYVEITTREEWLTKGVLWDYKFKIFASHGRLFGFRGVLGKADYGAGSMSWKNEDQSGRVVSFESVLTVGRLSALNNNNILLNISG